MRRQELSPDLAALYDRPLSADEIVTFLAHPVSAREIEETRELVEWFKRRYPTARERFAYNRRAYARAVARTGIASPPTPSST